MKRILLSILALLALTPAADAANRFAVCTTTCTWDNSSTAMWSTSTGGATGASAPTTGDAAILDASTCVGGTTCTVTVNANLTLDSITMGACTASTTGCILDFSAHNNNVAFVASGGLLSITGTGTRTLKMGNGNWSFINTTGTMFNATTTTNLTLTPNSSTIVVNNTNGVNGVTFTGGNLTFNNITINANTNAGILTMTGNNTWNAFTINGRNFIDFGGLWTTTITTLTSTGTLSNIVSINNATFVITNPVSAAYTWLHQTACNAGAPIYIFNNSFDAGQNSTCVINAPPGGGTACILGGWLLWRDMPGHLNDNFPAWLEKAA